MSVPRRAGADRQTPPHQQPRLRSNSWDNLGGISPPRDRPPDAVPAPPVCCLLGAGVPSRWRLCPHAKGSFSPSPPPPLGAPSRNSLSPPSLADLCSHSRALRLQCGFEEETRSVRVGSSLSRWNPDDWFHGVGERGSEVGSEAPVSGQSGPGSQVPRVLAGHCHHPCPVGG